SGGAGSPGTSAIRLTQCVGMSCSPSTNFTRVSVIVSPVGEGGWLLSEGVRAGAPILCESARPKAEPRQPLAGQRSRVAKTSPEAVIPIDLDNANRPAADRHPERIRPTLDHQRRHLDRIQLLLARTLGTSGRMQRK